MSSKEEMDEEYLINLVALDVAQRERENTDSHELPDLGKLLFGVQKEFFYCTARVKAILAGRRGGKSVGLAAWMNDGARTRPGSVNTFISITRNHAKINFWPILKAFADASGVPYKSNEQDLTVDYAPRGGLIVLGGADKLNQLDKYRGSKAYRSCVDECGVHPSYSLQYLHRDVLRPATVDLQGQVAFGGTPGITKSGYWFDMTNEHSTMGIPVYSWTMLDNPTIPHAASEIELILKENSWTMETPTFQREYLAMWTDDVGQLVFPVSAANKIQKLPTHTSTGHRVPLEDWRYVISVDIGYVDDTAIVLSATHPMLKNEYVCKANKYHNMLVGALAGELQELLYTHQFATIVMDVGGMGKMHAAELERMYSLAIKPAEKTQKESAVRITRDKIIAHVTQFVVADGACNAVLQETEVMGWNKDKTLWRASAIAHATDAMIYGLREQRHYLQAEKPKAPEPGSPLAHKIIEDQMLNEAVQEYKRRQTKEVNRIWRPRGAF